MIDFMLIYSSFYDWEFNIFRNNKKRKTINNYEQPPEANKSDNKSVLIWRTASWK